MAAQQILNQVRMILSLIILTMIQTGGLIWKKYKTVAMMIWQMNLGVNCELFWSSNFNWPDTIFFLCRAAWERIQFVDTIYAIGEARIIYRWFGMTMDWLSKLRNNSFSFTVNWDTRQKKPKSLFPCPGSSNCWKFAAIALLQVRSFFRIAT